MEWISVKDELPKDEKQYLILTNEIGYYRIACWEDDIGCFVDLDDYPHEATHWMPLPKPPKK